MLFGKKSPSYEAVYKVESEIPFSFPSQLRGMNIVEGFGVYLSRTLLGVFTHLMF